MGLQLLGFKPKETETTSLSGAQPAIANMIEEDSDEAVSIIENEATEHEANDPDMTRWKARESCMTDNEYDANSDIGRDRTLASFRT